MCVARPRAGPESLRLGPDDQHHQCQAAHSISKHSQTLKLHRKSFWISIGEFRIQLHTLNQSINSIRTRSLTDLMLRRCLLSASVNYAVTLGGTESAEHRLGSLSNTNAIIFLRS